jgi:hypothetical protein
VAQASHGWGVLKSSDPKVVAAVKAYGEYREKNGVVVSFQAKGDSNVQLATDSKGAVTGVNVTLNSTTLARINNAEENSAAHVMALADVAHEGSHVETDQALIHSHLDPRMNITNRQSEIRAYGVTNAIVGPSPWNVVGPDHQPADLSTENGINRYLNSLPPNPEEPLDAPIYTPPQ